MTGHGMPTRCLRQSPARSAAVSMRDAGDNRWVRAMLREVVFDPDPAALPGGPEVFAFLARLMVGPSRERRGVLRCHRGQRALAGGSV
jgi:hypothetical protein